MKNKQNKGVQTLRLITAFRDSQIEPPDAETHQSWLEGTLKPNAETGFYQSQALSAEIFLQRYLLPRFDQSHTLDEATLINLMVEFNRSSYFPNAHFEMAHVTARLLSRFQCFLLNETDSSPLEISRSTVRELDLFSGLSEFDFQYIDKEVHKRLQTG